MVFPLTRGVETDVPGRSNIGLQNPTVNLIFAGNWTNYQQDEMDMIAAVKSIVSGPFLTGLEQYSSSGTATFGTWWNDPNTTPGATLPANPDFSTGILQAFIEHSVAAYRVDPGLHDIEHAPIDVAILDPLSSQGDNGGYNLPATYTSGSFSENLNEIFMGTQTDFMALSRGASNTFSHEFAERDVNDAQDFYLPPVYNVNGQPKDVQVMDGEQEANYNYVLNGYSVQAYWSDLDQAAIVPDTNYALPHQNIFVEPLPWVGSPAQPTGTFNLVIQGDQLVNKSDVITVSETGSGGVSAILNGEAVSFDPGEIIGVTVNSGIGQDFISVQDTLAPTTINSTSPAAGPDDNVLVGSPGSTQGITSSLVINNTTGYDVIGITDANDTAARTISIGGGNPYYTVGGLTGNAQAEISFLGSGTRSLYLDTGAGGNHISIYSLGMPTTITGHDTSGGPADFIDVSFIGSTQGILQKLVLQNSGMSYLTVDDSTDATTRYVTLNNAVTSGFGAIIGIAQGEIDYQYSATPQLVVKTGPGAAAVSVLATGTPTTVRTNSAVQAFLGTTVDVGNSGSVQNIAGELLLANTAGAAIPIVVNDSVDAYYRTANLSNSSITGYGAITGLAPAEIDYQYAHTSSIEVMPGTATNTVNILATGVPTIEHGNAQLGHAAYSVNIGNAGTVQGILGFLTLSDPPGSDDITANDSTDTGTCPIVLSNATTSGYGAITGLAPAEIDYAYNDTNSLTIDVGSNVNNTIAVHATGAATLFTGGNVKTLQMDVGTTATASRINFFSLFGRDITNHGNLIIASDIVQVGGISNFGSLYATDSQLTGNDTNQNGGALQNATGATAEFVDCLINSNSANASGGAVYNQGALTINNSTLYNNAAVSGGGVYNAVNATMLVTNSILDTEFTGGDIANHGSATVRFSDVHDGWTGQGQGNLPAGTDPKFVAGPTFQLQSNSPCIDKGNNADVVAGLTDLAGNARISPAGGTVDMGAYEFQGVEFLSYIAGVGPTQVGAVHTITVAVEQGAPPTGTVVRGDSSTVSLTVETGPGTLLGYSGPVPTSGGYANFSNVSFSAAGYYNLLATDSNSAIGNEDVGISVSAAGVPTILFYQPAFPYTIASGTNIPSIVVHAQNGQGNPEPSGDSIVLDFNGHTYTLTETNGTVTFSVPTPQPGATTNYPISIQDLANGATNASSITITVPVVSHNLNFSGGTLFGTLTAPATISGLQVIDEAGGQPVSNDSITLSITPSESLPSPATTNTSGVASFGTFSLPAGSYSLTATDAEGASVTKSFVVNAPAIKQLVFGSEPAPTTLNDEEHIQTSSGGDIIVDVENSSGQILNGLNGTTADNSTVVTLTLLPLNGTNYSSYFFGSGLTGTAVNGVVDFGRFYLEHLGTGFQMLASASGDNSATSTLFNENPGSAAFLALYGGGTATAGTVAPAIHVSAEDTLGDVTLDSSTVTLVFTGPGTANANSVTYASLVNGSYIFNDLVFDTAGTYSISATDSEGLGANATTLTVIAAAPAQLGFVQQPSSASLNYPIQPTVSVGVEDQYGNVVTTDTSQVTLALTGGTAGAVLDGSNSVASQSGTANFPGLSVNELGTGYMLDAVSASGYTAVNSSSFNILKSLTIHVDPHGSGADGLTWSTAYTSLKTALLHAVAGDTIDMAQGDYSPNAVPGVDPTSTFQLISDVTIQGGYQTGGTNVLNPAMYPTVLDGGGFDYHVVTGSGTNYTAVLEGVTITDGNASGGGDSNSGLGGGLIIVVGSPQIDNVTFTGNTGGTGGALYIANDALGSATVIDCIFTNNSATNAYGIDGGAVALSNSSPLLVNDLFAGNSAGYVSALLLSNSSPTVTNCTFTKNIASHNNTYAIQSGDTASVPVFTNCILWNDTPNEIQVYNAIINYSDVEGGYAGTNNTGAAPMLSLGFHLVVGSTAVGAGEVNAPGLAGVVTDLAGQPRFNSGTIDMGAYEGTVPPIIYVDASATTGGNTGASWATAFTNLRSALSVATPGYTIEIARGDYSPGSVQTATFQLLDGVTIQGGYQPGGMSGPNPALYPTLLDGAYSGGRNYHVITCAGTGVAAVLEDVTIENGDADNSGDSNFGNYGGGLVVEGGRPTVSNCLFTGNTAISGGAIYYYDGVNNPAQQLINCVFKSNTATNYGGAIYNFYSSPSIVNCLFYGNSSYDGGAIMDYASEPTLTNCTIVNNSAAYTGAIENKYYSISTLDNCILWNDTGYGGEITNDYSYDPTYAAYVSNSDIYGGPTNLYGTHNINLVPLFVNSTAGNYQLMPTSPCIAAGDPTAADLVGVTADLAGNSRFINGAVDMGAYEVQASVIHWTGLADGVNWYNPGNWSDNLVPTRADDVIIGSGFTNVVVSSGIYSVNILNASSPLEIAAGGTLNFYGSSTISNGGTLAIDNGGALDVQTTSDSLNPGPFIVYGLTIGSAGTLDLGASAMVLQTGTAFAITAEIASGYNGGLWTGTGITSSSARNDRNFLTGLGVILNDNGAGQPLYGAGGALGLFDGYSPGYNDVLVKYTYYGDANLDGKVDGSDYSLIDSGFISHYIDYYHGDFNYNNVVDGSDYTLIDNVFNSQGAALAAQVVTPSNVVATTATAPKKPPGPSVAKLTAANAFHGTTPIVIDASSSSSIEASLLTKDKLDALTTFSDQLLSQSLCT